MSDNNGFKTFKLIILLIVLPLLFLVPYMLSKSKVKDASLAPPDILHDLITPDRPTLDKLVINKDKFETKAFTARNQKNGDVISFQYIWKQPKKPWPKGIRFPLVIHLHDMKSKLYSLEYLTERDTELSFPAFHIAPISTEKSIWSYHKKTSKQQLISYVNEAVESAIKNNPIDQSKVYIVGCAEGAVGAFGAIQDKPNLYSAAIGLSGYWSPNHINNALSKTPLYVIAGTDDKNYPIDKMRHFVQNVKENGGLVHYKEIESMENNCGYQGLYKTQMWEWLFKQKKR